MNAGEVLLHATCVALSGRGVLLLGRPGSGKSDLALRLIDEAAGEARLVSDDQVLIAREGDRLVARAPAAIAGKMEMRGFGIVDVPHAPEAALSLVVELAPVAAIERLPEPAHYDLLGLSLPLVQIDPASPSAAARVRAVLVRA